MNAINCCLAGPRRCHFEAGGTKVLNYHDVVYREEETSTISQFGSL